MNDNLLTIERQYAIVLADRGYHEYINRAANNQQHQIEVLIHYGLPIFLFLRRRFTRTEAVKYVKDHPSQNWRYLMEKAHEYKKLVERYTYFFTDDFIDITRVEAKLLIRFERNDDLGHFYC